MKKGMDPTAVQKMGQQTEEAGQNVQELFSRASSRVSELDWTGEDRDAFVQEFESTIGQLVQAVVQQTSEFASRAAENATQQIDASS